MEQGASGRTVAPMPGDEPPRPESALRMEQLLRTPALLPQPSLIGLGTFTATRAYVYRRHQHLGYELIVPLAGRYRCRVNGVDLRLRPGEALLVKPGDWHEDQLDVGVSYVAAQFSFGPPTPGQGFFAAGIEPRAQVCTPPRGALPALLERMRTESARADPVALLLLEALLAEAVAVVARSHPTAHLGERFQAGTGDRVFPARLERVFAQHLQTRLPVARMAAALGCSPTALGVRCRRLLHLSPAKAFARFRLERAKTLLERTGMTVVEISDHLGFPNPFHFSRAFRRVHGLPPSAVPRPGASPEG